MNRELWNRILQVAIVAPYVYALSRREKNEYFSVGLKLVAGGIVIANLQPLIREAAPVLKVLADAAMQSNRTIDANTRAKAIDGEYSNV